MTEPAIVSVLESKLIEKHMKTIIEMEYSGNVYMLQNDNKQDLLSMFKLPKLIIFNVFATYKIFFLNGVYL